MLWDGEGGLCVCFVPKVNMFVCVCLSLSLSLSLCLLENKRVWIMYIVRWFVRVFVCEHSLTVGRPSQALFLKCRRQAA